LWGKSGRKSGGEWSCGEKAIGFLGEGLGRSNIERWWTMIKKGID